MFKEDIYKLAKENNNFRKVIKTGKHSQIVLMSIPPAGDIGLETHKGNDQALFFVAGKGEATVGGKIGAFKENDVVFVPAGTEHNFKNTGSDDLKLFTIYAPPHHPEGTAYITKADAEADENDK